MAESDSDEPAITVVVVTFRGRHFIADCLDSLMAQSEPHRLLVIDNNSTDGTAELLRLQFPHVQALRQESNLGFAGAVQVALDVVSTPLLALLNDDAVADPDWLKELVTTMQQSAENAAVTSRMLLSDGIQPVEETDQALVNNLGVALTTQGYGYDIGLNRPRRDAFTAATEVFGFSGGAALIRADALRAVGGSPAHFFLYYEDVDMSWRLRLAGHRILSCPAAVVHHRHSATIGPGSDVFHFHNERNRLLTLLRCATLAMAIKQLGRFTVTTGSLAAKMLLRRPVPPAGNFRIGLRLHCLRSLLLLLPRTVGDRRSISRQLQVSRSAVAQRWLGFDPLV